MKAKSFTFFERPYTEMKSIFLEDSMMNCLECQTPLKEVLTRRGVLIDVCPQCQAKWLDKGEIHYFYPQQFSTGLFAPCDHKCPKCDGRMTQGKMKGISSSVLHCLSCQGFWLKEASFIEIPKTRFCVFYLFIYIYKFELYSPLR